MAFGEKRKVCSAYGAFPSSTTYRNVELMFFIAIHAYFSGYRMLPNRFVYTLFVAFISIFFFQEKKGEVNANSGCIVPRW